MATHSVSATPQSTNTIIHPATWQSFIAKEATWLPKLSDYRQRERE